MTLLQALTPILVYLLPIGFFLYMGIDVLLRNSKKVEHRLVSIISGCYVLLFMEEYVRHQLPIEYSPMLFGMWFGNVGALLPSFLVHFILKFSGLSKKLPRFVYPYLLYLPVLLVLTTILGRENDFNGSQFVQMGLWKAPVYNASYYTALTIGILFHIFLYMPLLVKGKTVANTAEQKGIFNLLMIANIFSVGAHIVLGYINYGSHTPPYPYLISGIFWCFFLRVAMKKYDFLNFSGKRFETLFNLIPSAILLVDSAGRIKEANPGAKLLFRDFDLDHSTLFDLLPPEDKENWGPIFSSWEINRKEMKNLETTIFSQGKRRDVLIDGEKVLVENEPNYIFILRDITLQKENQKEITFLAYHDPLTRLPNRRYFYEKFDEAIYKARMHNRQLAVLIIDLDRFKETNDKYGHQAGDDLLQHVAVIIQEAASVHGGMAGRWAGMSLPSFWTASLQSILWRTRWNGCRTALSKHHLNTRIYRSRSRSALASAFSPMTASTATPW